MERAAVDKAKGRLQKAKDCIARIKQSKEFAEFESAWVDLLIALNTVHVALEQGARSSPQSRQWYGGKKKIRTKDSLLSYLHQARNSDEHGIDPVAAHKPKRLNFYVDEDDNPIGMKLVTHMVLIPVFDKRFNTRYDPPDWHLGKLLPNNTPLTVGRAAIAYHEALIAEAEKLVT